MAKATVTDAKRSLRLAGLACPLPGTGQTRNPRAVYRHPRCDLVDVR